MNRNLSPYQFTQEGNDDFGGIHAYVKGRKKEGVVGQLYWNQAGMITSVAVHPEHQRRGLATEMHRRASKVKPGLHHAPAKRRTPEGVAWSGSVGSSRNNPASGYGYGAS